MSQPWYTSSGPEQDFLSQYQLSDDERRRLLLGNVLLGLGGGLMTAQRGNMLGAAGSGAVQGAQLAQSAISDARRGKMDQFKLRMAGQEYQDKMDQRAQAGKDQAELSGLFSNAPDLSQMGPGGPTEANAQAVAPSPIGDQYRKAAAFFTQRGRTEDAKRAMDMAASYDEKYNTTPQVMMQNGQPVNALISDRGKVKTLDGYAPPPKFREVNRGGSVDIVNDYGLPAAGTSFAKTMTPGEEASNKLGWAQYGLSKNADARAAAAASGGGKPQWDAGSGQFVYPPSPDAPGGRAVSPQGFTKPEKPLTEMQSKATAYVNQMQNATQVLSALEKKGFTGGSKVQQAAIVAAGTEGNWIPGSAAIPRWAAGEDAQRYENAELQWTEPVLRFLTGANAPKEEVKRNAATFFPRPGDDAGVIAQKAAARANMEQSIRLAAGSGSAKVPDRAGAKQVVRTGTEKGTGRKVVQYSDGTTEYQ